MGPREHESAIHATGGSTYKSWGSTAHVLLHSIGILQKYGRIRTVFHIRRCNHFRVCHHWPVRMSNGISCDPNPGQLDCRHKVLLNALCRCMAEDTWSWLSCVFEFQRQESQGRARFSGGNCKLQTLRFNTPQFQPAIRSHRRSEQDLHVAVLHCSQLSVDQASSRSKPESVKLPRLLSHIHPHGSTLAISGCLQNWWKLWGHQTEVGNSPAYNSGREYRTEKTAAGLPARAVLSSPFAHTRGWNVLSGQQHDGDLPDGNSQLYNDCFTVVLSLSVVIIFW